MTGTYLLQFYSIFWFFVFCATIFQLIYKPKICCSEALFYKLCLLNQPLQEHIKNKALKRNLISHSYRHIHTPLWCAKQNKMELHQVLHLFLLVCNSLANIFTSAPPVLMLSYKFCICFTVLSPPEACPVLYLAKLFLPFQHAHKTALQQKWLKVLEGTEVPKCGGLC